MILILLPEALLWLAGPGSVVPILLKAVLLIGDAGNRRCPRAARRTVLDEDSFVAVGKYDRPGRSVPPTFGNALGPSLRSYIQVRISGDNLVVS